VRALTLTTLIGLTLVAFAIAVRGILRAKGVWGKLAWGVASVLIVLACAAAILPSLVKVRTVVSKNACMANLKQIEGAKATWAMEFHKAGTDTPTESDLIGPDHYIRKKLTCPQGGIYRLGAVSEKPACSLGGSGHSCP
jgi:competence protein ComGC